MCEAMRWNHLPVHGGIYDQHPSLLHEWRIIWSEKGNYEKQEAERQKRDAQKNRKG